jgi:hypothetical protein
LAAFAFASLLVIPEGNQRFVLEGEQLRAKKETTRNEERTTKERRMNTRGYNEAH